MEARSWNEGAGDVIAAESAISAVDGLEGRLIYRGYDIHDLAEHVTFEEVVHLLWTGELPTPGQLADLNRELGENRALPELALALIKQFPENATAIDSLRTAVSLLSFYDPDTGDNSYDANRRKAVRLTAQMGTVVATLSRISRGMSIVDPLSDKGTAWNFLYMLTGEAPSEVAERAFDVALVLHADHELNSSTLAARIAVETLTDMYSAVTAALGTLFGPLHGGANVEVMHMFEQIGEPENAAEYVADALRHGRRLMGFGHRMYKTVDPRATSLRRMARELAESSGNRKWYEISEAVEVAANKALAVRGKTTLKTNIDFFSAPVYNLLGIPTEIFSSVFAVSRISGWSAHILEQLQNNKPIRTRARYIGPTGRKVVPIVRTPANR